MMNKLVNYYMNYVRGTKRSVCLDAVLVPLSWINHAAMSVIDSFWRYGLAKT